jgi:hypothetical protein
MAGARSCTRFGAALSLSLSHPRLTPNQSPSCLHLSTTALPRSETNSRTKPFSSLSHSSSGVVAWSGRKRPRQPLKTRQQPPLLPYKPVDTLLAPRNQPITPHRAAHSVPTSGWTRTAFRAVQHPKTSPLHTKQHGTAPDHSTCTQRVGSYTTPPVTTIKHL